MNLGPQFEQPELPGMPAAGAPTARRPETLQQYQGRQRAAGVGTSGRWHDQDINDFANSPMVSRTPTGSHHLPGDQLKAFMTPREIEREWQPLDGDRHDGYALTSGTNDPRAGMETRRAQRSDSVDNIYLGRRTATGAVTNAAGNKRQKMVFKRPSSTSPNGTLIAGGESTPDLWDRKYEEATEAPPSGQYDFEDEAVYRTPHGHETSAEGHYTLKTVPGAKTRNKMTGRDGEIGWYRSTGRVPGAKGGPTINTRRREETWVDHELISESSPHNTMVDSIIGEGIKSPIRLGLKTGSEGKPQLAGGHHRMAVARVHAPDKLAPVLYHKDIFEARSSNTTHSYKYT